MGAGTMGAWGGVPQQQVDMGAPAGGTTGTGGAPSVGGAGGGGFGGVSISNPTAGGGGGEDGGGGGDGWQADRQKQAYLQAMLEAQARQRQLQVQQQVAQTQQNQIAHAQQMAAQIQQRVRVRLSRLLVRYVAVCCSPVDSSVVAVLDAPHFLGLQRICSAARVF